MPYVVLDPTTAAAAPAVTVGAPLTAAGGKTLAVMDDELNFMIADRGDVTSTQRREWINDAYVEMTNEIELEELRASFALPVVAAQPFYKLPTNLYTIIAVSDPTEARHTDKGAQLEKIEVETYRQSMLRDEGYPGAYFRWGNMLVVDPVPDAAATFVVEAWFLVQRLTADNHEPILQRDLQRGLLLKARAVALGALEDYARAAAAHNEYTTFMRSRPNRKAAERENLHAGVVPARRRSDLTRTRRPYGPPEWP